MSGTQHFTDNYEINPYMGKTDPINVKKAAAEHAEIKLAFEAAGIKVSQVTPPAGCQDGVYTANWGLVRGNKVVLSSLPNKRHAEQAYAKKVLGDLGLDSIEAPYKFSGQGDALPCGNFLFMGSRYRTDPRMSGFISEELGYNVINLKTVPLRENGVPVTNKVTGWPDSFFYDIDLALSVITPELIAWCPEAFVPESQAKIRRLDMHKIEVSYEEATKGFACNLVSTGQTVIMSGRAPLLKRSIEDRGLKTITPPVNELVKGGGYIRCVSLTLGDV